MVNISEFKEKGGYACAVHGGRRYYFSGKTEKDDVVWTVSEGPNESVGAGVARGGQLPSELRKINPVKDIVLEMKKFHDLGVQIFCKIIGEQNCGKIIEWDLTDDY